MTDIDAAAKRGLATVAVRPAGTGFAVPSGPTAGLVDAEESLTGAGVTYVNAPASVALRSIFVTTTSTTPAACAGVMHVRVVALMRVTLAQGVPSNVTVVPV